MGTHGVAVRIPVGQRLVAGPVHHVVVVDAAAQLLEFTMQVQHLAAAGALVQVIDVLGDDAHVVVVGQPGQRVVRRVGLSLEQLAPARVVEIDDQLRIAGKGFRRGHLIHPMPFPQAIAVTEGLQATVGADACTTEDDDASFHVHLGSLDRERQHCPSKRARKKARAGVTGTHCTGLMSSREGSTQSFSRLLDLSAASHLSAMTASP